MKTPPTSPDEIDQQLKDIIDDMINGLWASTGDAEKAGVSRIRQAMGAYFIEAFDAKLPRLPKVITKEYNDGYADAVLASLKTIKKVAGLK